MTSTSIPAGWHLTHPGEYTRETPHGFAVVRDAVSIPGVGTHPAEVRVWTGNGGEPAKPSCTSFADAFEVAETGLAQLAPKVGS